MIPTPRSTWQILSFLTSTSLFLLYCCVEEQEKQLATLEKGISISLTGQQDSPPTRALEDKCCNPQFAECSQAK